MSARGSTGSAGAALVAVVLITLALFALGHGLLILSLGELAASRAAVRQLESRAGAESAVRLALAVPAGAWMDSVSRFAERSVPVPPLGRARGKAALRRLSAESWLVEGVGYAGPAEARTARMAWAADPLTRVTVLGGVVSARAGAPAAVNGVVDATAPTAVDPPLDSATCAPWSVDLDAHYLGRPLVPVAALDAADTLPRLGLLDFDSILAAATVTVGNAGTPAPSESANTCVLDEPWNWGDPAQPWRACGAHLPLRASAGSLVVEGGEGQALLVVDGDVTLRAGARLYGLVLASGALRLEDGASLVGMAVAAGGLEVASTALIRGSACWAVRAVAAQRATLGRLRRVPGVGAIGPL